MDYEGFKIEVHKLTNINLDFYKEKQMKRRIDSLIKKHRFIGYLDFFNAIKTDETLRYDFVTYLTINVSEFYRNPEQWEVLHNHIFPKLLEKPGTLKIWSAACSTGDEPYTLAMVLNNFLPLANINILATDIDKEALKKADLGVYTEKSLEKLPVTYLNRYFTKHGDSYKIKGELKKRVNFFHHDLLKDPYPTGCDLVVCRNVIIYFTEEAKNHVYTNLNKSLRTGGILFVGSTEQIIRSNHYKFTPLKTFFYKKEGELAETISFAD